MDGKGEKRLIGKDRVIMRYDTSERMYYGFFYVKKASVPYKTKSAPNKNEVRDWIYDVIKPEYKNVDILDDCFD